jgi:molybdopterin synthase catalytic subunit
VVALQWLARASKPLLHYDVAVRLPDVEWPEVEWPEGDDWIAVTGEPLAADAAAAWATTVRSGAVVSFLGVVRNHADGREDVQGITYEAYETEAAARLVAVAAEARVRWPAVERIALLHRIGELALSEASVAVVVSSPHRAEAFDAARYCIDTLKETVPIWKREHWAEGSDWSPAAQPVQPVRPVRSVERTG